MQITRWFSHSQWPHSSCSFSSSPSQVFILNCLDSREFSHHCHAPHFLDSWGLTPPRHFLLTSLGATLSRFPFFPFQHESRPSPMGSAHEAAGWSVLNVLENSWKPVAILYTTHHPKIIFQHWFSNYSQSSWKDSIVANSPTHQNLFVTLTSIPTRGHSWTHAEQQKIQAVQHTRPRRVT